MLSGMCSCHYTSPWSLARMTGRYSTPTYLLHIAVYLPAAAIMMSAGELPSSCLTGSASTGRCWPINPFFDPSSPPSHHAPHTQNHSTSPLTCSSMGCRVGTSQPVNQHSRKHCSARQCARQLGSQPHQLPPGSSRHLPAGRHGHAMEPHLIYSGMQS